MKRNLMNELIEWKAQHSKTPLLLRGIRGVGKTSLALEFSRLYYQGSLYLNFDNDIMLRRKFLQLADQSTELSYSADSDIMITGLFQYFEIPIELSGTILIIIDDFVINDSVQNAVSQFLQEVSLPNTILISGETPHPQISALCTVKTLFPMGFDEFLTARGSEWYTDVIKGHYMTNKRIPEIVHNEMLNLFQDYMEVGGMPAAVNEYLRTESTQNIPEIHKLITYSMKESFQRVADSSTVTKMEQLYQIFPRQLLKSNKKFQYNLIRKGATHNLYKDALNILSDNCYIHLLRRMGDSIDDHASKLYAIDLGLLSTYLLEYEETDFCKKKEKILIENYVLQELSRKGISLSFWESGSQAKVDIVIQSEDGPIPIEIKLQENSRLKSISIFKNHYKIPYMVKISSKNFDFTNNVKSIPYYAIFCLS